MEAGMQRCLNGINGGKYTMSWKISQEAFQIFQFWFCNSQYSDSNVLVVSPDIVGQILGRQDDVSFEEFDKMLTQMFTRMAIKLQDGSFFVYSFVQAIHFLEDELDKAIIVGNQDTIEVLVKSGILQQKWVSTNDSMAEHTDL